MHNEGTSRRQAIAAFSATAAATWITPSVIGFDAVAAATSSIVSAPAVTGDALLGTLSAGESLRPDGTDYSSNTNFYVFQECSVTLGSTQSTQSGDTLPTGVEITSYLVHYSPASGNGILTGTVTFPGTILGYDWGNSQLAGSDATWGVPSVTYGSGRRAMEWPGNDDLSFTLPSLLELEMYAASAWVDQIRVYVLL